MKIYEFIKTGRAQCTLVVEAATEEEAWEKVEEEYKKGYVHNESWHYDDDTELVSVEENT